MIGGEWKRAGGDRQSTLLVRFRLYRTSVGVISGLLLFRLVAFWVRSAMGWSVPFSLGELLVEGPLLGRSETDSMLAADRQLVCLPSHQI
jgi:hypothetical protein